MDQEAGSRRVRKRGIRAGKLDLIGLLDEIPIGIAYKIAFITNFYREPLLRQIELSHGLTRPEWTILICLSYRDRLNPRDICAFTEQPRNNISRGAALLAGKGLITQEADPADARRAVLCLSPAGRAVYDEVMPLFVARERDYLSCLEPAERIELDRLLDRVARHLSVDG
jgi:DNA-binding MarR family transcriptional regulator